jgi:hypothetical protein
VVPRLRELKNGQSKATDITELVAEALASGGDCSEGRLHGMGDLVEAVLQVTGRPSPRQIADDRVAFVAAESTMLRNSGLLIALNEP